MGLLLQLLFVLPLALQAIVAFLSLLNVVTRGWVSS